MAARLGTSLAVALVVTCGLFWGMQSLIAMGDKGLVEGSAGRVIDFVRLKRNSELELKRRTLPDRVKPKLQPRQPALDVSSTAVTTAVKPMPMVTPKLDADFKLQGGMNLGVPASDRGIVPVVRVRPMYPQRAAQRHIEGWVEVTFDISSTGSVKNARVVNSQPSVIFDRAALRAIRKWKYKPEIVNGVAVETSGVTEKLTFDLEED